LDFQVNVGFYSKFSPIENLYIYSADFFLRCMNIFSGRIILKVSL